jgi:hypothetical protein
VATNGIDGTEKRRDNRHYVSRKRPTAFYFGNSNTFASILASTVNVE